MTKAKALPVTTTLRGRLVKPVAAQIFKGTVSPSSSWDTAEIVYLNEWSKRGILEMLIEDGYATRDILTSTLSDTTNTMYVNTMKLLGNVFTITLPNVDLTVVQIAVDDLVDHIVSIPQRPSVAQKGFDDAIRWTLLRAKTLDAMASKEKFLDRVMLFTNQGVSLQWDTQSEQIGPMGTCDRVVIPVTVTMHIHSHDQVFIPVAAIDRNEYDLRDFKFSHFLASGLMFEDRTINWYDSSPYESMIGFGQNITVLVVDTSELHGATEFKFDIVFTKSKDAVIHPSTKRA